MKIAEGREHHHGVNINLSNFRLRFDPYFRLEKLSFVKMPCYCLEFWSIWILQELYVCYHRNNKGVQYRKIKYYSILGKQNRWVVIEFVGNGTDD